MLYVQRFFSLAIHCTLLAVFFFPSLTGSLYGYKSLSTYHSAYHSAFSPVASARIDPRSLMQKATHFLEASCEIGLSNIEAAGPETSQSTSMQSTSMQSAAINPPLPVLKNALHFIEQNQQLYKIANDLEKLLHLQNTILKPSALSGQSMEELEGKPYFAAFLLTYPQLVISLWPSLEYHASLKPFFKQSHSTCIKELNSQEHSQREAVQNVTQDIPLETTQEDLNTQLLMWRTFGDYLCTASLSSLPSAAESKVYELLFGEDLPSDALLSDNSATHPDDAFVTTLETIQDTPSQAVHNKNLRAGNGLTNSELAQLKQKVLFHFYAISAVCYLPKSFDKDLGSRNLSLDVAKIEALNHVLFQEQKIRFPHLNQFEKKVSEHSDAKNVLQKREGVCLGVSLLYYCLAQNIGLPLEMITPPGHIYLRYSHPKSGYTRNIETTAFGVHFPAVHYESGHETPFFGTFGELPTKDESQISQMLWTNQGAQNLYLKDYQAAFISYQHALESIDRQQSLDEYYHVLQLKLFSAILAKKDCESLLEEVALQRSLLQKSELHKKIYQTLPSSTSDASFATALEKCKDDTLSLYPPCFAPDGAVVAQTPFFVTEDLLSGELSPEEAGLVLEVYFDNTKKGVLPLIESLLALTTFHHKQGIFESVKHALLRYTGSRKSVRGDQTDMTLNRLDSDVAVEHASERSGDRVQYNTQNLDTQYSQGNIENNKCSSKDLNAICQQSVFQNNTQIEGKIHALSEMQEFLLRSQGAELRNAPLSTCFAQLLLCQQLHSVKNDHFHIRLQNLLKVIMEKMQPSSSVNLWKSYPREALYVSDLAHAMGEYEIEQKLLLKVTELQVPSLWLSSTVLVPEMKSADSQIDDPFSLVPFTQIPALYLRLQRTQVQHFSIEFARSLGEQRHS